MSLTDASPRLSVALHCEGHDDLLANALASVQAIADELLVIDAGMSAESRAVAQAAKATVVATDIRQHAGHLKNFALQHARGEWFLWLQSNEQLEMESARGLRSFLNHRPDRDTAYLLLVELPPSGADATRERVAQIRLLPRVPGVRFDGRARALPHQSLEALRQRLDVTQWKIIRAARPTDAAERQALAQRELCLVEQEIQERGPLPRLLVAQGECYLSLDQREIARDQFKGALAKAARGSTEMLEAFYGLLSCFGMTHRDREDQVSLCLKALEVYPFDAQLLCAMGSYMQALGRLQLAQRAFESAVEIGQVNPETWHIAELGEVAAVCCATTARMLGDEQRSREMLEEALTRHPDSTRLRRQLLDLHIKMGRTKDALAQVVCLPALGGQRDLLRTAVKGACEAAQQRYAQALPHLQQAYTAGCKDPLCFRWLAMALWGTGQTQLATACLKAWSQLDPQHVEPQYYLKVLSGELPAAIPQTELPQAAGTGAHGGRHVRVDSPSQIPIAVWDALPVAKFGLPSQLG